MDLPVDFLRTFVSVVDGGGFTRAALVVGRTQSAVSQQVKRLEEQAGQPLFVRGRELALTPAGESLLPYARRMVKLHDEAVSSLKEPGMSGLVRIGVLDDYAGSYLPQVLAAFAASHPNVQVEVRCEYSSRELLRLLHSGGLDLAVHSGDAAPPGARLIGREPLVWVASGRHLAHEKDPLPLAVFDKQCRYRQWALEALERAGRPYRIAYTSPSVSGVLAAVGAGLAVAPMGRSSVPEGLRLLTEEQGFPPLPVTSIILSCADTDPSGPVKRLGDAVFEGLAEGNAGRSRQGGCGEANRPCRPRSS